MVGSTGETGSPVGRVRRLQSNETGVLLVACLAAWLVFLPLLGPWMALVGLAVPATLFFPSPPFMALWQARNGPVTFTWSWRRLMRLPTLALPLVVLALVCVAVAVTPPGTAVHWIALAAVAVSAVTSAMSGAVRMEADPRGAGGTILAPHTGGQSVASQVTAALLTAVVSGGCAWVVRERAREVSASYDRPGTGRAADAVRWMDAQLASSGFGPTYDRQWYWVLLVGAAGLLTAGCSLLLRSSLRRASAARDPFDGTPGALGVPAERVSKVFVSYSRADKDRARRLCARLEGRLGELWVDWQAIRPSEKWRASIAEGIRTSDAFVVLLSRNALSSPYCWDECRQAIEQRKRVLPVVIDPELTRGSTSALLREHGWDDLTAFQYLSLVDPDEEELAQGVEDIVAFVEQHHQWVAFQVRLGVLAHRWWEGGRSDGQLLRADELAVAEAWRRRTPREQDFNAGLTERQQRFLEESRGFVRRRALLVRSALAAGTAAIVGLSVLIAAGQSDAEAQYRAALSRKLVAMAEEVSRTGGEPERALQYVLAARGQADTAEARNAIADQLAHLNRVRSVVAPRDTFVNELVLSRKGDILLIDRGGTTEIWDVKRARSRGVVRGSLLYSLHGSERTLSADGRTVALLSDDATRIDLVDTTTLRVKDSVSATEAGVPTGQFETGGGLSPDGERLVATEFPGATNDFLNLVWDVRRHRVVGEFACIAPTVAPSGRQAVCADNTRGQLVDLTNTQAVQDLGPGVGFTGFTAEGGMVVAVAEETRVYEPGATRPWVPAPGMAVVSRQADPSIVAGRYAVLADAGKTSFELWDLQDRRRLGTARSIETAVVLRRGEGAPDIKPGGSAHESTSDGSAGSETYSADGSIGAMAAADGSVVIWEKEGSGRSSTRLPVPAEEGAYAVGPDARTVAVASGRTVSVWDTSTGERTGNIRLGADGTTPAISRDGSLVAVAEGFLKGEYELWVRVEVFRVRDGRRVARFETASDSKNLVGALLFSPDGRELYAALTGRQMVVAWNVADPGKRPRTVARTDGYADHAALSPDGSKLASISRDGGVDLWDVASGTHVLDFGQAARVTFSPDGKTLAVTDYATRSVSLWNWERGERTGSGIVPRAGAFDVAFSHDGRRLAITGSPAGGLARRLPVTLWDLSSRRQVGPQLATVDARSALGFTPDGASLVTAGPYGTYVAHIAADTSGSSLCDIVTRRLSASEWQAIAPGERFRWPC
ncbi:toll/interleukin-1 receptor domain-containing protein [Streptomyces albogriseolus]|uniref:toll/interleukin-1 receptor domain-containing protein n=1 Tax=Streptomyces albogriseolus TaxID=1887 RepID=UPI00378B98E2